MPERQLLNCKVAFKKQNPSQMQPDRAQRGGDGLVGLE